MKKVVRVAASNNFNCTPAEWRQLEQFSANYPENYFFINANIITPKLVSINDHNYKAVITINPNLTPEADYYEKLTSIDRDKIAFVRLKWLPDNPAIHAQFISLLTSDYNVVLTLQRFNKKATLWKYTDLKYYQYSHSRYRLHGEAFSFVQNLVDHYTQMGMKAYICDRSGMGCMGCMQCSTLNDQSAQIYSLNLSSSGICPYNCPDCYAKTLQRFCTSCGYRPMIYDVIRKNKKQNGSTKHIKAVKAESMAYKPEDSSSNRKRPPHPVRV